MQRIEIERVSADDPHRREKWEFGFSQDHGMRLMLYSIQTRQSNKHKWKGDFWDHMDERSYHSKLQRPTSIPNDVIDEAFDKIIKIIKTAPVYVGWFNKDYALKWDRGVK